jgi:acyl-coenzyme A synthetase/AMP-(fatty) acid ligase
MTGESSGTTGTRKLMPITYGAVWRRIQIPETQDDATAVTLNMFPPLSAHGARVNAGALVAGGTNLSQATWAQLVELGINRVTGSPSHVKSLIERDQGENRIRSIKVAGASVSPEFVANALRHAEELHLAYGATEVGAVAHHTITHVDQFDGSVGLPNEGAAFQIVDEAGRPVATGVEGVVRVRTRGMVAGYIDEPELTAKVFRDGWFHPGDLGFIDARGALHITGRTNEVLNINGTKFNATVFDEIVQQYPGVSDGFCFVDTDAKGGAMLCAIVALQPGRERTSVEALGLATKEKLGFNIIRRAYVVESVPRNEGGKPMRAAAKELAGQREPIEIARLT